MLPRWTEDKFNWQPRERKKCHQQIYCVRDKMRNERISKKMLRISLWHKNMAQTAACHFDIYYIDDARRFSVLKTKKNMTEKKQTLAKNRFFWLWVRVDLIKIHMYTVFFAFLSMFPIRCATKRHRDEKKSLNVGINIHLFAGTRKHVYTWQQH